jgi:hypothetical protein
LNRVLTHGQQRAARRQAAAQRARLNVDAEFATGQRLAVEIKGDIVRRRSISNQAEAPSMAYWGSPPSGLSVLEQGGQQLFAGEDAQLQQPVVNQRFGDRAAWPPPA